VLLTIAYRELFDPDDRYSQGSVDDFTRTTERPTLSDRDTLPPAAGSLVLLARIQLNGEGKIESDGSIDTGMRTPSSARLAPTSIATEQLVDNAVTLAKLAPAAQPRVNIASGVATFSNLMSIEQVSSDIDPGFGAGAVAIQLVLEDVPAANLTGGGDPGPSRPVQLRGEVNRATGKFRVFALRTAGSGQAKVRWYAFRPQPGADSSVSPNVSIDAPTPMAGNSTQILTARVNNLTDTRVNFSVVEPGGGTLTVASPPTTPPTVLYNSPALSGAYHVKATSVAVPTETATVEINVTGAITVVPTPSTANILTIATATLSGDVINTSDKRINWSVQGGNTNGRVAPASTTTAAAPVVYTPPTAPGVYTVIATSVADPTKQSTVTINVTAIAVAVTADDLHLAWGSSTTVRATVTPATVDNRVNWTAPGTQGVINPVQGTTTTFSNFSISDGVETIIGTSVADPTKSASVSITVNGFPVGVAPPDLQQLALLKQQKTGGTPANGPSSTAVDKPSVAARQKKQSKKTPRDKQ
jgi:hypothetical protein